MAELPPKLREYLDDFGFISSREERIDYLIDISDEFKAVPASIATQPYDEAHRVIGCESEAFVWAIDRPDGTLDFYFDVLNPQGLSAMALSAILDQACSGAPLDQVAAVNGEVVFTFFGRDISMGKGRGLTELINAVVYQAKRRLHSG
ncbi:MAG: SufE family protein [Chloroflexota bacterium]|nr:SufE family protein [Chloroflexota bacterium]MDE2945910.1 SufE family protein [Chloroflexota bacterium]